MSTSVRFQQSHMVLTLAEITASPPAPPPTCTVLRWKICTDKMWCYCSSSRWLRSPQRCDVCFIWQGQLRISLMMSCLFCIHCSGGAGCHSTVYRVQSQFIPCLQILRSVFLLWIRRHFYLWVMHCGESIRNQRLLIDIWTFTHLVKRVNEYLYWQCWSIKNKSPCFHIQKHTHTHDVTKH